MPDPCLPFHRALCLRCCVRLVDDATSNTSFQQRSQRLRALYSLHFAAVEELFFSSICTGTHTPFSPIHFDTAFNVKKRPSSDDSYDVFCKEFVVTLDRYRPSPRIPSCVYSCCYCHSVLTSLHATTPQRHAGPTTDRCHRRRRPLRPVSSSLLQLLLRLVLAIILLHLVSDILQHMSYPAPCPSDPSACYCWRFTHDSQANSKGKPPGLQPVPALTADCPHTGQQQRGLARRATAAAAV